MIRFTFILSGLLLLSGGAPLFSQGIVVTPPASRFSTPSPSDRDSNGDQRSGTGSSAFAYTNSMDVLDNQRKLRAGDRLSFRVVEDRKPPTPLIVTDSGEMEVPLIGRVSARGKTCKSVALEIKKLLEVDYFRRATVILGLDEAGRRSRGIVYLTGQIRNQGAIELPSDDALTLSQAILRGGGFADFADRKRVKILRKTPTGGKTIQVDLGKIIDKGHLEKDVELQPDDIIIVTERLINF